MLIFAGEKKSAEILPTIRNLSHKMTLDIQFLKFIKNNTTFIPSVSEAFETKF